jgi:aminoglycoside phosphotransferase (APT) family kinase protein
VELRSVERLVGAFQEGATADQIQAMVERAFGRGGQATSAVELGGGMYNSTYRVEVAGAGPVVLRVAPEPARQSRLEWELMRNEYAVQPYLAPVAELLPRTLFADFTHEIVGRDYMFQTLLDGVPAAEGLSKYPQSTWGSFFAQLGSITRRIHDVRGSRFGPVARPTFTTWSETVISSLHNTAADLEDAGVDAEDVTAAAVAADKLRAVLDEVTEPRLLTGDLWTVNCLISGNADQPTITGVIDFDRASWGASMADWTIFMARRRPGPDRDMFWDTYGAPPQDQSSLLQELIYRSQHLAAIRSERHRMGRPPADLQDTYAQMSEVLALLR